MISIDSRPQNPSNGRHVGPMFKQNYTAQDLSLLYKEYIHGCLGYVGCRRDCRIGTLSTKMSVFIRKRESFKIRLIVCIFYARFGDPTTSLEFLR